MTKRLGVAIVGAGFMGGVHAQILSADPRVRIRWVIDQDLNAGTELARRIDARAAASVDEALGDPDVQLVVVATPAATHEAVATAALRARRHVLVEKPLVLRAEQAQRLARLAEQNQLIAAYGGNFVYAPKFVRARELAADAAAMGSVHSVRVAFRTSGPDSEWFRSRQRAGGGAVTDLGWHAIELCRWMVGKPDITAVSALTRQVTPVGDVEEHGVVLVEFSNGVIGQCDVSWLCPGGEQLTVEVLGTNGIVSADLWRGMGIAAYTNAKFGEVWEPNGGWVFPEWEWIRNSGYEHQDRHVVDAIVDNVPLAQTVTDAVAILRALEAAYESSVDGRRVEIRV